MDEEYLGVVQLAQLPREGSDYGRLRPTHVARKESWEPIVDAVAEFPDRGMVFWHKPNRSARHGSVWAFAVTRQPSHDPSQGKHDRMQVAGSERTRTPLEAIVLPDVTDIRELRRALLTASVKLPYRPVGRVLLRVPGPLQEWIGPIDPAATANADPLRLVITATDGFFKVHDIPEEAFQSIDVEGHIHRLLRPKFELPSHPNYFSVQNDAELLRAMLKRLKKRNPNIVGIIESAEQLVSAYDAESMSDLLSREDRSRERARLRAAQSVLSDLRARFQLDAELQLVALELLELPEVRAQLNVAQQEELDRKQAELQAEMRLELEVVHKELAEKQAAIQLARAELQTELVRERESASQELAQVQAATLRAREELDELAREMQSTIEGVITSAIPKLTEHALFRALHAQPRGQSVRSSSHAGDVRALMSVPDIVGATTSAAVASHVDPFVLRSLTSLLAGAGLVLLGGPSADRTAVAAARLLASGSSVRVSVTPAVFSSADLMRAPCSPVSENDGYGSTLGEFLQRVQHEDGVSLVILQGCNRAPPENSLLELIEFTAPPRRTGRFAWIGRSGDVEETAIDGRVLFIGTLVSSDTAFRVPASLARRIPALWADRSVTSREVLENAAGQWTPTRATAAAWNAVGEQLPTIDEGVIRSLREIFIDVDPEAVVGTYVCRVAAAFAGNSTIGFAEALASLVAGRAEQDRVEQFSKGLPSNVRDVFDAAIKSSHHLGRYYAEEQQG